MATPSSKQKIPLFVPGQTATMVTDRPAMTLGPNEFADLTNFRCRDGALKVRPATATWTFTGLPATPEFCASWSGTYFGDTYVILCVRNGTAVDIYDSPDGLAFTLRSGVSAAAGIFPHTSLTYANWQANNITFVPVTLEDTQQAVLISDGVDTVVWCPALSTLRVREVSAFTGEQPKDCSITGSPNFLWDGSDIADITGTGSATFVYTAPAGAQVAIANPQVNGNQLLLEFTSTVSITSGSQLYALFAQSDVTCTIFESCKVEVYNGTSYFTVYDPAGTDNNDPSVEVLDDDYGIGSRSVLYTWGLANALNTITGSISRIRFTYTGTTDKYPAATLQLLAAGLGTLGVPGTPDYGVSYWSSWNFCESAFTVLDSAKATGIQTAMLTTTGTKYFSFPISDVLRLAWTVKPIPAIDPSIYNGIRLYRRDPGSNFYLLAADDGIADWTGNAGFPANTWVDAAGTKSVTDNVDETGLNPEIPAPSVYNEVIGGFTCGTVANDRVIVGSSTGYKFSEFDMPLRFSQVIDPDNFDRSSGGFTFPAEVAKSIAVFPTSSMVQQVGIFTDQSLYMLSGLDAYALLRPGLVSRYGTKSGKSLAVRRGDTFILDDALHITQFPSNQASRNRSMDVKNILEGIPAARVPFVVGATFGDRYYLFYTPSGGTINNYAFVLDLLTGTIAREFYGDTKGVVTTFLFEGNFIGCLSDGTAFRFEADPTGSVAGCSVLSREINAAFDTWMAGRQVVYCSDSASTPNAVWNNYPDGQTVTSVLDLNAAGSDVRTNRYTALGKGIRGKSVQLGISGTIVGGTDIYSWQVETEDRVSGADV